MNVKFLFGFSTSNMNQFVQDKAVTGLSSDERGKVNICYGWQIPTDIQNNMFLCCLPVLIYCDNVIYIMVIGPSGVQFGR